MAITRIKNNQITDGTINVGTKCIDGSVTAGKLEANLVYGSDLTVSGNLIVNGTTTTINTTDMTVEDPLMVLGSLQSGAPSLDLGFIGNRGTQQNVAFIWDESADEFVAGYTNAVGTESSITVDSYANLHVNDLVMEGSLGLTDLHLTGDLEVDGTSTLHGAVTAGAGISVTGTSVLQTVTATSFTNTGSSSLQAVTATDIDSSTLDASGNVTVGGTLGVSDATTLAGLTAGSTTLASASVTNNLTAGGNITTTTGDITGANIIGTTSVTTAALTASGFTDLNGNLDVLGTSNFTGDMDAGNIDSSTLDTTGAVSVGTTLAVSGESTLASATVSDLTDNEVVIAGTNGALEGDSNFTFDGTDLKVGVSKFDVAVATGNTSVGGTLGVTGQTTMSSASVGDLTAGRVVLAGTSGELEDSINLTFDGSNLTVDGDVSVSGSGSFGSTITLTGGAAESFIINDGAGTPVTKFSVESVTGNTTIAGTLGVTGATTVSTITATSTADFNGATTMSDLTIDNGATVDLGSNVINGVSTPVANTDAANKAYVDAISTTGWSITDGTTTEVIQGGDVLHLTGTANEVDVSVTATDIMTIGLPSDVTIGNNLTVDNNASISGTLGAGATTVTNLTSTASATLNSLTVSNNATVTGTLTSSGSFTANSTADFNGTTTMGDLTIDATSTLNAGANKWTNLADPTIAQDAATKAYVDSLSTSSSALSIAGDTGTDTVTVGTDTFTFSGTANEVETAVTNNTLTIGLPNDVTISNNLVVTTGTTTGSLHATGAVDFDTTLNVDQTSTFVGTMTTNAIHSTGTNTINGALEVDDISIDGTTISGLAGTSITIDPYPAGGNAGGDLIIAGNLVVNGTTTTVNSTVVEITDPTMTMGDNASTDAFDRGLEMKYNDGAAKIAFSGYDQSADEFIFIPDSTNTSGVITGALGNAAFGSMRVTDLSAMRIVYVGPNGELIDDAGLTFDSGVITVSGGLTSTSGTVTAATVAATTMTSTTITTTGLGTFDSLQVDNNSLLNGKLEVVGLSDLANVTASGTLAVTGESTLHNTTWAASSAINAGGNKITNVADPVNAQDAVTLNYLTGTGAYSWSLSDGSASTQQITNGETLSINGTANEVNVAVSNPDTLTIGLPDDVSITSTLSSGGKATLDSMEVTNNSQLLGDLDVNGSTQLEALDTNGTATLASAVIQGNATVGGTLGVTGNTTLTTVTTTGAASLASASVTGNATVGGTLGVTGATTLAGLTAAATTTTTLSSTNISASGTLGVTGATTLNDDVTISGGTGQTFTITDGNGTPTTVYEIDTTTGNVSANGSMTIAGATDINGATTMGNLTIDAASTISMGSNVVTNVSTPLVATDAANKSYVDGVAAAGWTITDGTTNQVISGGDVLHLTGTANEVDVSVTATDIMTIGLPSDVTIGNDLTVTNDVTIGGDLTATTGTAGFNILNTGGLATLNSAVVSTTLGVTQEATFTGQITGNGGAVLSTAKVSDLTAGRVVLAGTSGELEDSGNLIFNGASLTVTGSEIITSTLSVAGTASLNGGIAVDNTAFTVADVTGNVATEGTLNVTGTSTLTTTNITGVATVTGSANIDNVTIDGNDISATSGELTINESGADVNFRVEGDTDANLLFVDAGTDSVNIGTATAITDVQFNVSGTDSSMLSKGTTAERPAIGVEGMLRYNTTLDNYEYYDGSSAQWKTFGTEFTVIATETFSGDDTTTAFTLASTQTTASCIVSINGVVQLPVTAYGVSGTTLTFTQAPATGDTIEVRELTTTTTLVGLNNGDSSATVEALSGQSIVEVKGDLNPISDAVYDLGSPSKQWKDLHLDGTTIYLGGSMIKNDAGTIKFLQGDGVTSMPLEFALDPDVAIDGGTY